MYPSNAYVNTPAFTANDFNPSLGIQDLSPSSSCLFNSFSPVNYLYEDEAIYSQHVHDMFYQQGIVPTNNISVTGNIENSSQDIVPTNNISVTGNIENSGQIDVSMKEFMCTGGSTDQPVAKKKMSKKDRHSKINTAHGPRDRRVRLSLDVARKYFGLQDMLGFDKPSKTMEWLFEQSKSSIQELTGGFPDTNKDSSSDRDVVSGIDDPIPRTTSSKTVVPSTFSKEKRSRSVRKPTFNPRAKESREMARERARERATEKRQQQQQQQQQLDDVQQSAGLMNWRAFGTGEEPVGTGHNTSNLETGSCGRPSALFTYHQQTCGIFHQHHLTADFQ